MAFRQKNETFTNNEQNSTWLENKIWRLCNIRSNVGLQNGIAGDNVLKKEGLWTSERMIAIE